VVLSWFCGHRVTNDYAAIVELGFVLCGTEIVYGRVPTAAIVPRFDVREDRAARFLVSALGTLSDELHLECSEEAFHDGIVSAVALLIRARV
jgi:hypothetical protein